MKTINFNDRNVSVTMTYDDLQRMMKSSDPSGDLGVVTNPGLMDNNLFKIFNISNL